MVKKGSQCQPTPIHYNIKFDIMKLAGRDAAPITLVCLMRADGLFFWSLTTLGVVQGYQMLCLPNQSVAEAPAEKVAPSLPRSCLLR